MDVLAGVIVVIVAAGASLYSVYREIHVHRNGVEVKRRPRLVSEDKLSDTGRTNDPPFGRGAGDP